MFEEEGDSRFTRELSRFARKEFYVHMTRDVKCKLFHGPQSSLFFLIENTSGQICALKPDPEFGCWKEELDP